MKRSPMKRRTPLKLVSEKRRTENSRREVAKRIVAKRSGGLCEAAALIATVDPVSASQCRKKAVDFHEKLKRSRGGAIDDPANIVHCCRPCHDFTEAEPALATECGLLTPSWA
jgi:hypothetical protein